MYNLLKIKTFFSVNVNSHFEFCFDAYAMSSRFNDVDIRSNYYSGPKMVYFIRKLYVNIEPLFKHKTQMKKEMKGTPFVVLSCKVKLHSTTYSTKTVCSQNDSLMMLDYNIVLCNGFQQKILFQRCQNSKHKKQTSVL